jgi:hypothetical protein
MDDEQEEHILGFFAEETRYNIPCGMAGGNGTVSPAGTSEY